MSNQKMPHIISKLDRTVTRDIAGACSSLSKSTQFPPTRNRVTRGEETKNLDSTTLYSQNEEDGDNYLHTAIIHQNIPLSMSVIDKAVSRKWLDFQNKLLQAPIHLAVLTNQPSIVSKLVESRADVMSRDRNGNTALSIACRDGLFRIVNILVTAVKHRYVNECLQTQMSQLFAVVNYEGHTCIHLAANNNHLEVVKFIIESGADINTAEAKTGRTILHNACISGDKTLVRYLTKLRSCNINAKSYDSLTPFDLARARSHDTICMVLAAAGARYGYESDDDV